MTSMSIDEADLLAALKSFLDVEKLLTKVRPWNSGAELTRTDTSS